MDGPLTAIWADVSREIFCRFVSGERASMRFHFFQPAE